MNYAPLIAALLLAACGSPQSSPRAQPTGMVSPEASTPGSMPPPSPSALPVPPPTPPTGAPPPPTITALPPQNACVPNNASVTSAQLTDRGVAVCMDDVAKTCWSVDFTTSAWIAQPPGVLPPTPAWAAITGGTVTLDDAGTHVKVCGATPADCKTIEVTLLHGGNSGAAPVGGDRVAVWQDDVAAVFDLETSKRVSTVHPWASNPDNGPARVRQVHGLGGALDEDPVIEVMCAVSPVSDDARLFSAATGKLIGYVGAASPKSLVMIDEDTAPFRVGAHLWAFVAFTHDAIYLQDTKTGKLVRTIALLDPATRAAITKAQGFDQVGRLVAHLHADTPTAAFVSAMPGIAPVATIDLGTGKRTEFPAPLCK